MPRNQDNAVIDPNGNGEDRYLTLPIAGTLEPNTSYRATLAPGSYSYRLPDLTTDGYVKIIDAASNFATVRPVLSSTAPMYARNAIAPKYTVTMGASGGAYLFVYSAVANRWFHPPGILDYSYNDGALGYAIYNLADVTKRMYFDLSSMSTATTCTFSFPSVGSAAIYAYPARAVNGGLYITPSSFTTPGVGNILISPNTGIDMSGTYNTVVGAATGLKMVGTNSYNALYGLSVFPEFKDGSGNTALGSSLAVLLTKSNFSTVVGYNSLQKFTELASSVVIGGNSLNGVGGAKLTSCCFIGNGAGVAVTDCTNTTSVGNASAPVLTTGAGNIFFGANAGNGITTGSNNICLGYGSGPGVDVSSSFCIGDNTFKAAQTTTTPTGGGASALPALPSIYLTVYVGTTAYKMPLYL